MKYKEEEYKNSKDFKLIKKLFVFVKPYKLLFSSTILSIIIFSIVDLTTPLIIQNLVDYNLAAEYKQIKYSKLKDEYKTNIKKLINKNKQFLLKNENNEDELFIFKKDIEKIIPGYKLEELIKDKTVKKNSYYLSKVNNNMIDIISKYKDLFNTYYKDNEKYFTIDIKDIKKISLTEIKIVKENEFPALNSKVLIIAVLFLFQFIFSILREFLSALLGQNIVRDLRIKLFANIAKQDNRFLQENPSGKIVTRITNDVQTISEFFSGFINSFLRNIMIMSGVVIVLFCLDFHLTAYAFLTFPILALFMYLFITRSRDAFRDSRLTTSKMNVFIAERISGIEVIKIFSQEKNTLKSFENTNADLLRANLKQMYVFIFFRPAIDFFAKVSIAIIIYYGAHQYLNNSISIGVLITFLTMISKFFEPMLELSETFSTLQSAMAGSERVFFYLEQKNYIEDKGIIETDKKTIKGEIEFKNVGFRYVKDKVINDMSFKVEPGEMIALVGYTGSGKTTITNLITRMWDIQDGQILIDGIDIKDIKLHSLRNVAQSLQQDVFLFNDTIKNNILMGKEIDQNRFDDIIDRTNLKDFINNYELKENAIIEEGAKNISAGQRQLISFARILVQDPQIIIMDEATANIDTETEKIVQEAMNHIMENRTSLVVAHRLSTIKHANRIFVLKNGSLLESGSHNELLKNEGLYYDLYKLQYKDEFENDF